MGGFAEDESEFDYVRGSKKGPSKWGEIKREWERCKNGEMQSPIDLSSTRVKAIKTLGHLNNKYKPSNAILKNRGHDISVTHYTKFCFNYSNIGSYLAACTLTFVLF